MAGAEAGAGAAETKREETMALVEEAVVDAVVKVEAMEEAEETTATTTMQEEVVAASMEAKAAEGIHGP